MMRLTRASPKVREAVADRKAGACMLLFIIARTFPRLMLPPPAREILFWEIRIDKTSRMKRATEAIRSRIERRAQGKPERFDR